MVPFARQPYQMGGDDIARLLMEKGRIQADAAQRSGDIWGNAVHNIGQQVGGAIQQHTEQKQLARRDAALATALETWDGKDPKALYTSLKMLDPRSRMEITQAAVSFNRMGKQAEEDDRKDFMTTLGGAAKLPFDVFERAWPALRAKGGPMAERFLPGVRAEDLPEQATPELQASIKAMLGGGGEAFTLGAGETRFWPDGRPIANVAPKPVEPPTPSFQAKDVLLDGKPSLVNFDSRTGSYNVNGEDVTSRVKPIPPQPREPRQESYSWVLRPGSDGKATAMRVREGEIRPGDQPYQGPQNQRLTAPERQDFAAMNYALPKLETFTKYVEANPDKWGQWDSFRMGVKQAIPGLADEEYASQEAFIARVNAEIRHALYGASLTGGEQQSAEGFIVSKTDQPARIVAKVNEAMGRARANVDYYRSLGFNVPAASSAGPSAPPGQPSLPAGGPKRISGESEYNALPSGAEFIGPDGKRRKKP